MRIECYTVGNFMCSATFDQRLVYLFEEASGFSKIITLNGETLFTIEPEGVGNYKLILDKDEPKTVIYNRLVEIVKKINYSTR